MDLLSLASSEYNYTDPSANIMSTHIRLIISLFALGIGLVLAGIGIFETSVPIELTMFLNLPHSAYKYLAFSGTGLLAFGLYQFYPLLTNRQRTLTDLAQWARQSPLPALLVAAVCIFAGVTLGGSTIWSFGTMLLTGQSFQIRPVVIGLAIGISGALIWLGSLLMWMSLTGRRD